MATSSTDPPKPRKIKKAQAPVPFRTPHALPRHPSPIPPWDSDEVQRRVPHHAVRPAEIPTTLKKAADAAGLTFKPELPDVFRHAVHRQGRPHAEKMMRRTTEGLVKKGVRFGSGGFDPEDDHVFDDGSTKKLKLRPYSDQELREAFKCFDLNGNDYVDVSELTHIFAQMGEMPTENEISAMILLCDPRGDGAVNFDDFLNIFSNPAEALRTANIKGIKHLLPRKTIDFDIRDPLGLVLEEKYKLKTISLLVEEVRRNSQAHDAGVKNGWKVVLLEGSPVLSEKDFENRISKLERSLDPEPDKGKGRGNAPPEPAIKQPKKYTYSIVFAVLPGIDDTSSEEEFDEDDEEEAIEEDDDDDDEDA